jgi:hypothetical protein
MLGPVERERETSERDIRERETYGERGRDTETEKETSERDVV